MTNVNLNFDNLDAAVDQAFNEAMFLLGREMTKAISDNVWQWPNPPSPRNIVDTGRLRGSQQLTFPASGTALFAWPVDYALYVHEGYTMKNGVTFPGRPWTTYALQSFDISRTMSRLLQQSVL